MLVEGKSKRYWLKIPDIEKFGLQNGFCNKKFTFYQMFNISPKYVVGT